MAMNETQIETTRYEGDWRKPLIFVCVFLGVVGIVAYIIDKLNDPLTIALLFVGVLALLLGAFLLGRGTQRDESMEMRKLELEASLRGRDEVREMMTEAAKLTIALIQASQRLPAPAPAQEPQVPPSAQLQPPSALVRQSDGTWQDVERIRRDAEAIMQLKRMGFPAPRRRIIEAQLKTTDHPRIARALDYLAERGMVSPAVDGGKREWLEVDAEDEDIE